MGILSTPCYFSLSFLIFSLETDSLREAQFFLFLYFLSVMKSELCAKECNK